MNYSDNNSLCSFNPVDYIDLETALAEEELTQHTNSRNVDNYRFSLKSIDDKDLDSFRRSLITPMSINSKSQDPMYANLTNTRHTRNNMIKRQSTTSPTHSCNESVTESVALFNNILNDHDGVDLVSSDIRDFMSPYDMDDLISRPGSRLPNTTPSPQNIGRFNRDALVSRHYTQPTIPEKTKRYTNLEKESNLNDNLLLTTTNKDTNDKVTPSISKPNAVLPGRGRKSSVDASVQTQSSITARRRLSSPAIAVDNKQKTLLKLSGNEQIHPSPPATTRIKRSDDRRRWSSHTYADDIKQDLLKQENNTKISNRLSSMNPLSSRYNHKSINNTTSTTNNLLPTSRYTKEKRASIVDVNDGHKQSYTSISRPVERRYSQKSSFVFDQQNESQQKSLERRVSNRNSLIINPQSPSEAQQRSLERRASNRNSLILDQSKVDELRNHDLEKRISARRSLPPTNHNDQQKTKLTPMRTTTTNLGRRSSHGTLSSINNNNNELGKSKNEQTTRVHDITLSSRYVQRRASHRELSSTNQSSVNELRSTRRVERRSSIQESSSTQQQSTAKSMKRYSYHGGYSNIPTFDTEEAPPVPTITKTEQRRARALSVPASNPNNELKPSLMPVPVSRFRKHSNNSLSRYETVPENEVAPPAKEVRFSLSREETTRQQHEEILPVTSRSTGGYSNSTASSSHSSGDIEYDPPTPPSSFIDKRRSMPSFVAKETPRRYNSYLARLKDTYETVDVEVPRRQRVVSEDNESHKVQRRQQGGQNAVTESARQLLAQVQQRRAKTAAILNGIYGP